MPEHLNVHLFTGPPSWTPCGIHKKGVNYLQVGTDWSQVTCEACLAWRERLWEDIDEANPGPVQVGELPVTYPTDESGRTVATPVIQPITTANCHKGT